MADSNASFIPKNTQRIQKRVRTTYRIYLLSYLSYVFFFGTLFAVLGAYFYAIQVQNGLQAVKADLETARQKFSEADIEGVRELEKRLLIANQLLGQLAAPSKVFVEVEKVVAANIKFIQFSYEALPNQKAKLSLTGKADDFNQILYQRDLLNSSILFDSTPSLTFDYAGTELGTEETEETTSVNQAEETTLTFIISNEIGTNLISYQPSAPATNSVTEVRGNAEVAVGTITASEGTLTESPATVETETNETNN